MKTLIDLEKQLSLLATNHHEVNKAVEIVGCILRESESRCLFPFSFKGSRIVARGFVEHKNSFRVRDTYYSLNMRALLERAEAAELLTFQVQAGTKRRYIFKLNPEKENKLLTESTALNKKARIEYDAQVLQIGRSRKDLARVIKEYRASKDIAVLRKITQITRDLDNKDPRAICRSLGFEVFSTQYYLCKNISATKIFDSGWHGYFISNDVNGFKKRNEA